MVKPFGKSSVASLVGQGGDDDDVVAVLPVHRRGHLVAVGQLERVDDAEDLVEVATGARRVGDGQADLVVGVDDEHRTDGEGVVGVRVDHVVEVGHGAVGVGDDREVEGRALGLVDVADPALVVLEPSTLRPMDLHAALVELGLEAGDGAELGGAHRGEVLGVREEDGPASRPSTAWKSIGPSVVSAWKLGASSPSRIAIGCPLSRERRVEREVILRPFPQMLDPESQV